MASMLCPLCGRLDTAPTTVDGIMYYSDHMVKGIDATEKCPNSAQPHAGMMWLVTSGQKNAKRVIWPGPNGFLDEMDE